MGVPDQPDLVSDPPPAAAAISARYRVDPLDAMGSSEQRRALVITARDPRAFGANDDVLSYFSLRDASFEERIEAASRAGFPGFGMLLHEYLELTGSGRSDAELRAAVDDHGVALVEIEALLGWGAAEGSPMRRMADEHLDVACHMAEVFGSRHLQVTGPVEGSDADVARAFARVCDRAADVGLRVAIEFLPPNNVPDARSALAIADAAGRENGGVCVDVWHHFRGARDEAQLRALPAERIVSIQLNDGTLEQEVAGQDYFADCLEHRRPCGEGEFDVAGVLGLLHATGCDAPRSWEVISTELQKLTPREAAARIAAGAATLPVSPRPTRPGDET